MRRKVLYFTTNTQSVTVSRTKNGRRSLVNRLPGSPFEKAKRSSARLPPPRGITDGAVGDDAAAKMSLAFDEFGRPFLIIKVRPTPKNPAPRVTIWRSRLPAHGQQKADLECAHQATASQIEPRSLTHTLSFSSHRTKA